MFTKAYAVGANLKGESAGLMRAPVCAAAGCGPPAPKPICWPSCPPATNACLAQPLKSCCCNLVSPAGADLTNAVADRLPAGTHQPFPCTHCGAANLLSLTGADLTNAVVKILAYINSTQIPTSLPSLLS